jgi:thiol-disulfide isomerase/thioredoxin
MIIGLAAVVASAWLNVAGAAYETTEPVDFTLAQLGGGTIAISDYRGEWVVVNYWATWCAPCVKEILGLAYEDVDDDDFFAFLEKAPVSYPILKVDVYDPPQPFGAPKVLPTTIILDPSGKAVKTFLGPVTRASIENYLESVSE